MTVELNDPREVRGLATKVAIGAICLAVLQGGVSGFIASLMLLSPDSPALIATAVVFALLAFTSILVAVLNFQLRSSFPNSSHLQRPFRIAAVAVLVVGVGGAAACVALSPDRSIGLTFGLLILLFTFSSYRLATRNRGAFSR